LATAYRISGSAYVPAAGGDAGRPIDLASLRRFAESELSRVQSAGYCGSLQGSLGADALRQRGSNGSAGMPLNMQSRFQRTDDLRTCVLSGDIRTYKMKLR
jgi:hypothetical protein